MLKVDCPVSTSAVLSSAIDDTSLMYDDAQQLNPSLTTAYTAADFDSLIAALEVLFCYTWCDC